MATIQLRSHSNTSGSGGLTQGLHVIDITDLSDYEAHILAGDITFALPTKDIEILGLEMNRQIYWLYVKLQTLVTGEIGEILTSEIDGSVLISEINGTVLRG